MKLDVDLSALHSAVARMTQSQITATVHSMEPSKTPRRPAIVTSEEEADNACFSRLENDRDDYYDQISLDVDCHCRAARAHGNQYE